MNDTGPESYLGVSVRAEGKKYTRESVTRTSRISINVHFFLSFFLFRRSSSCERPRSLRTRFAWSRRSGNGRRKKERRGGRNFDRKPRSSANNCGAKIRGRAKATGCSLVRMRRRIVLRCLGLFPMLEAAEAISDANTYDCINRLSALRSDVKSRFDHDGDCQENSKRGLKPRYNLLLTRERRVLYQSLSLQISACVERYPNSNSAK